NSSSASALSSPGAAPGTALASSPAPGSIPSSSRPSLRGAARRCVNIPPGRLGKLGVAENTATLHNVVVCTLCSCYPHDLLGDPPWWYRDDSYKERIVQDPRGTLADRFNLRLPESVEVRVHDSTSDVRWMVLPRRPAGTNGWSEEELARLVTIDSLVGTAQALTPAALVQNEC